MICPPQVAALPDRATHGGFWFELRDDADAPAFVRAAPNPLAGSVEVHSPDGAIRRVFGPPADAVFEVLVPDRPDATTLVLVGDRPPEGVAAGDPGDSPSAPGPTTAAELARFDLGA